MGRLQIVIDDDVERKFREFLAERGIKKGSISEEVETLIRRGMSEEKIGKNNFVKQDAGIKINEETRNQIQNFFDSIETLEKLINKPLIILEDKKIKSFYTECHVLASTLIKFIDLDPSIDPDYQEEFKSNRSFEPNNPDYLVMVEDAKEGRQFSDIVIEYNPSQKYKHSNKPLKVYGGQHRCHAITEALNTGVDLYHGIRVYFNLEMEQRGNIAIISNKNIQVSKDLLDRMSEQSLLPPNKLRDWCYKIGLLDKSKNEDFSSKRSRNIITVALMRTFIVNFYGGKTKKGDFDIEYLVPSLADSGGDNSEYSKLYKKYNFVDEEDLVKAGKDFVRLHKKQTETAEGKAKMLALTLSITSSWSFAVGLLQKNQDRLKKICVLPDLSDNKDPLKSEILSQARGDEDPPLYRGMITRYGEKERGRLLQLFLIYSKSKKGNINKDMVKLAIEEYHAKEKTEKRRKLAERVL